VLRDVIDLILADHRRIRRLQGALRDLARSGDADTRCGLAEAWQRLAELLEAHCAAEEEICHLAMFGAGPKSTTQAMEAVADHDDIREAIGEADLESVGSPCWWRAVSAALNVSARHMDTEERGMLADCGRRWSAAKRRKLGLQWSRYIAARRRDADPSLPTRRAQLGTAGRRGSLGDGHRPLRVRVSQPGTSTSPSRTRAMP
jgi:hypothetical protein